MSSSPIPNEKCVVLVDDEIAYVDLLAQLLSEHLSCPVRGFTKPAEALRALPGLSVGLVVTDYQMPEMNGLSLIAEVQKIDATIPVVLITGHTLRLSAREEQELSALRAIIHKPFKWRALAAEISRHWAGTQAPHVAGPSGATPGNL